MQTAALEINTEKNMANVIGSNKDHDDNTLGLE